MYSIRTYHEVPEYLMVDPQTSRFWLAARQSGLLDLNSLTSCWEAIPIDKRNVVEYLDRRLARQAVQQSLLTLWQAQQLLAGRTSGFQVDRYLLLDLIGHGGMGRVYLARDTRLNRLIALKILAPERMSNSRAIARFQREARVGAQLQHENLVRIYDFGESNGRYFLVMEFIDGKTVGSLISAQGSVPPLSAARIVRQIALGLEHAHRKGLIHRDVNPYNILITQEGIAKLADLGLAIDLAEEGRVTRDGATVGTFDYLAPEQARHSHAADTRSDIYSLGCTLYHMISGQVPFPSPSLPEKLFAHQVLQPRSLNEVIPDIPLGLAEVVQRMMRKAPEERYATPLEVAQALEPFAGQHVEPRDVELKPGPPIPDQTSQASDALFTARIEFQGSELPMARLAPFAHVTNAPPGSEAQSPLTKGSDFSSETSTQKSDENQLNFALPPQPAPTYDNESSGTEVARMALPNLGLELHSTDTLTHSKNRPERKKPGAGLPKGTSTPPKWDPRSWHNHSLSVGLAALALVLTLFFTGYVSLPRFAEDRASRQVSPHGVSGSSSADRRSLPMGERDEIEPGTDNHKRKFGSAFTVLGADGEEMPVSDFARAMEIAVSTRGWVILHNRDPILLPSSDRTTSSSGNAWLKLRAGQGLNPVLIVETKDRRPFLVTGSAMSLILEGITIVARYPDRYSANDPGPPPVILAGGPVQLRHCAIVLEDESGVTGSRAVFADGGALTVENCWFKGFDIALDIRSIGGSTTLLKQLMTIPPTRASAPLPTRPPTSSVEGSGWGIRVQFLGGGRAGLGRRLVLDHCTITGTGVLRLAGFSADLPLLVEARQCAVQSRTLMGWESSKPGIPFNPQSIRWQGEGNQLDIRGPYWLVPLNKSVADAVPEGINQDHWLQFATERNLIPGPIEFHATDTSDAHSPGPREFSIRTAGPSRVGADPNQVGPQVRGPSRSS
jgi:serine/threonine-protein kinase